VSHTVGVPGAGTISAGVGGFFTAAGHRVALRNTRGPDSLADVVTKLVPHAKAATLADAAAASEVLLAVPWTTVHDTLSSLGPWEGRVLIDATNAIKVYDPPALSSSTSVTSRPPSSLRLLPQARAW
jgi:predicted dinucleotide-binding enzyme